MSKWPNLPFKEAKDEGVDRSLCDIGNLFDLGWSAAIRRAKGRLEKQYPGDCCVTMETVLDLLREVWLESAGPPPDQIYKYITEGQPRPKG